jgi:coniferyl-aldehyde dehydrogenase
MAAYHEMMTKTSRSLPMHALFDAQYQASRAQVDVPLAVRRDRLHRIKRILDDDGAALAAAVQADFGVRSPAMTEVADVFIIRSLLSHLSKHLARWMKPVKVATPVYLAPATAHIHRQPLGVVGIISPWNYPIQMALAPAATALAAGNRVLLKPSEMTPRTSALLADRIHHHFAADEFAVIEGDAAVAAQFAGLPFDHLFFTGSTAIGRKVAAEAAGNLTPTTLELGGKSPCIIDRSCNLDDAAVKIAHGKLLNAGQTCIAPDYLLLPRGREMAFEPAFAAAVARLFPRIVGNPDYASIQNDRHFARQQELLADARAKGATLRTIDPRPGTDSSLAGSQRQMPPVLVYGAEPGMRVMEEEIFGPILPVVLYDTVSEVIETINSRPRPLALYWFGDDEKVLGRILSQTVSGGVTVNDTLLHIAHENLPFGGVGDSGWGAYHGHTGFLRFTHEKSVFTQSRLGVGHLFYPPYGLRFDQVIGMLRRML